VFQVSKRKEIQQQIESLILVLTLI